MVPQISPAAKAAPVVPQRFGQEPSLGPSPEPTRGKPAEASAPSVDAAAQNAKAALERAGARFPPNARLSIDRDDDTGRMVYRSVDRNTGEVLAQWPSEEVLARIKAFTPDAGGVVVDRRV